MQGNSGVPSAHSCTHLRTCRLPQQATSKAVTRGGLQGSQPAATGSLGARAPAGRLCGLTWQRTGGTGRHQCAAPGALRSRASQTPDPPLLRCPPLHAGYSLTVLREGAALSDVTRSLHACRRKSLPGANTATRSCACTGKPGTFKQGGGRRNSGVPAQRNFAFRREPPELPAPACRCCMISTTGQCSTGQIYAVIHLHLPATCSRKAVSERFSSAAMLCSVASSTGCCSRHTAAGLPANLVDVKASAFRKKIALISLT